MMMNVELSSNTKAILLLTAPLILGRGKSSARPLSVTEYDRLARRLHEHGRQPADLLSSDASRLLRDIRPDADCERISRLLERGFLLSQAIDHWQTRAIWVISRADPSYPIRFKHRLGKLAPPVIYGCGDATLLENGGLAVVGSRDASDELLEYTAGIGRAAAAAQCTIISGGARGIDHAAMSGTLAEWGTAVGVLADRLERAAMDRGNREVLLDGRLVLLSPYDPNAGFNVGNAMQRNKLIYALADAGLVVESGTKGGTWTGALEQLDKMRSIPIYARSSDEIGKGLQGLIRKGALAWPNPQTAEDFRSVLSGEVFPTQDDTATQPSIFGASDIDVDLGSANTSRGVAESATQYHVEAVSAAAALIDKAEELLALCEHPITVDDTADYLGIPKGLARIWLERLVENGKYAKKSRPVRYERKASSTAVPTIDQLL